jgi:hypothetical protein
MSRLPTRAFDRSTTARLPGSDVTDMTKSIRSEWIHIQCMICAHTRRRDRDARWSEFLNWGTVAGAAATALSAGLSDYHIVTVLAGGFTAAVAMFERVFAPTKSIQNLWRTQRGLETAQQELSTLLYSLQDMATIAEVHKALNRISENARNAIGNPIAEIENDRKQAEQQFEGSSLYPRFEGITAHNHEGRDAVIPDDARGVIAVGRRRRP